MEQARQDLHFLKFPYPREAYDDGTINHGGIDLTREPQRIDEIVEAQRSPHLRRLLEEVNLQDGLFMTLGCDYRQLAQSVGGYVDFTFRSAGPASLQNDLIALDDFFWAYLTQQEWQHQINDGAMVRYARSALAWSWSPLEMADRQSKKVTVAFCCQRLEDCEWCLDHVRHFLVTAFPALPMRLA